MIKEIFRIIIKKICQAFLIISFTPFMLLMWGLIRIKLFIEEASKSIIREEKKDIIEFWRDIWKLNSIDCLNLKQLKLYSQIKRNYKKNKLIVVPKEKRDIGKTTMLIKFAAKENIPIAVPYLSWKINLDNYCKNVLNKKVKIITLNDVNSARGRKFEGLLFEEGFKEDELNEILDYILPHVNNYTGIITK